jgi:hypothetical protein
MIHMILPHTPIFKFSLIALLTCCVLFDPSQLQAGASNKNGNPYGNGTFFPNDGTFSAVVRGENLSGTIMFSTGVSTNGANTNSSGSSVIIYGGNTYMGNVIGMWNPSAGTIEGQIWGGQRLSGSNSSSIYPEFFNTNYYPVLIPIVSNNTNTTNTNYYSYEPQGTNYVNDGVYMNGSFDGGVANSYPNQTFTASGTMIQQQLAATPLAGNYSPNAIPPMGSEGTAPVQVSSITIPITVQGIRIANTYTSFATVDNSSNVPFSATYYTITNPPLPKAN